MYEENEKKLIREQVEELKQRLTASFVFKRFEKDILIKLESKQIEPVYEIPFTTFKRNIQSLVSVVRLPIEMSFERAIKLLYDNIKRRHTILAIKDKINEEDLDPYAENDKDSRQERIVSIASAEFNAFLKTEEGRDKFWLHSLAFVNNCAHESHTTEDFLNASKELVNQATLLTWSALEIFMRDFFIIYLNKNPDKIESLSKVSILKQKFDLKSISTDQLMKYNFDLSANMGDILIENFDFSNIELIKTIYNSLFDHADLSKTLKHTNIWNLYQNRNLIVHKGGIVDKKFVSNTDTKLQIGEKLFIQPIHFQEYFASIINVVIAVADAIHHDA